MAQPTQLGVATNAYTAIIPIVAALLPGTLAGGLIGSDTTLCLEDPKLAVTLLPLFGNKDHAQLTSVKSIPHWEEAIRAIGEEAGVEYESLTTQPIPTIYGGATAEIARDKDHITMLVPSSLKAKFDTFKSLRLYSLETGLSPEAKGGTIVGHGRTCVSRLFVDSFAICMKNVDGVSQEDIQARVHKAVSFPMLLVSDLLTMIVAPIRVAEHEHWETGKYAP